uniref:Putative secreted protein n=1 Tax=Ixodes ricinus TaxID=34613 RepID=A0A6B0UCA7_IXORI
MLRANPRTLFLAATTCSLRDTEASERISVLFACSGLAGRRLQGHFCRPLEPVVPSAPGIPFGAVDGAARFANGPLHPIYRKHRNHGDHTII